MAGVQKLAARMIDYGERLSGMADAAEGKRLHRKGTLRRWLVLPASGAALYAVMRSEVFARGAKDLVDEAKSRAADLNEDLASRVRDTVAAPGSGDGAQQKAASSQPARAQRTPARRSPARKPASARRTTR